MNRIPHYDLDNPTAENAKQWIKELHKADLSYHFDDDPREVGNSVNGRWVRTFTDEECDTLDPIVDSVFSFDFDPFEILIDLVDGGES